MKSLPQYTFKGDTYKEGDIVRTYTPGVHRIVAIHPRTKADYYGTGTTNPNELASPLVDYVQILNSKMKVVKSKQVRTCDWAYLSKVSVKDIAAEFAEIKNTYEAALEVLKKHGASV